MACGNGICRAGSKIWWREVIVSTVHKVVNSEKFYELATLWISELAKLPGWISGAVARSVDETDHWLITQHWQDAGSCRRALSKTELRPIAFELAQTSVSDISTFEPLVLATNEKVSVLESIRAKDADTFSLSDNKLADEV